VVGRRATGETFVAIQSNVGTAAAPVWTAGARLDAPELGIRAADVVEVVPDDPSLCPATPAAPEPTVATDVPVLAPDPAAFPGGALKLAPGSCFEAGLAAGQVATATITVRASGLVLTSDQLGYLGRPVLDQPFVLQHQDEATLTGEALAVARKVRRRVYPVEGPCPPAPGGTVPATGCYAGYPWLADPLASGPAIAFRPGLANADLAPGAPGLDPVANPAVLQTIARGARIVLRTQSGMSPAFFKPSTGGVRPTAILAYDKTPLLGHENDGTRFYAAFLDDQMLDFSPSLSGGDVKFIR
jgi:hypothetical protein